MSNWYGTVALIGAPLALWAGVKVRDWWLALKAGGAATPAPAQINDHPTDASAQLNTPADPPGKMWGRWPGKTPGSTGEEAREDPRGRSGEELPAPPAPDRPRFETAPNGTEGVWIRPGANSDEQW